MLKYRLIFGPILIVLFLLLIWLDDQLDRAVLTGIWKDLFLERDHPPRGLILFGLCLVILPIAAAELSNIFRANAIQSRTWLTALAAIVGLCVSYSVPARMDAGPAIAVVSSGMILVFVLAILTFSRHKNVEGVVAAAGGVVFAMVYLGLLAGFLLAIRRWHSAWWIVGIIMTTKMCDTGAYFTGRLIGKHKLIPWLSPGKTKEGLAGGVITAMLTGMLFALASRWLPDPNDHVSLWLGLVCGVTFGIVGQLGDLTMSLFKRDAGIKDSSTIIPGLGGALDVLDSPLLVAPVAYWLLAQPF